MENKLVVKNTCIIVNNYEFGDCPTLENYFRIYNPVTFGYSYIGLHYDVDNKRLYLPRGIDIWFVEKMLQTEAYVEKNKYNKCDKYDDIMIRLKPRNDRQKQALRFMLGNNEYKETASKSQLSVNLNTGVGKTYVSIVTSAFLGIKTMVITYSVNVLNQWKKCILEYTNVNPKEIYHISGSGSIFRLLEKSEEEIKKYKFFLVTHGTLKSYGDTNGWEYVTELFEKLRVGIKIYDEAHQNFENMYKIDFYTNVYKTYYLTATAMRSSEDENRIYQMSFKNVLSIDLFDEEEDPHTNYIAIKYNSRPTPQEISMCKNQYGLDRNKYTNLIVTKDNFYKAFRIILDIIINGMKYPKYKCLIYIGTNNAIITVYNWIIENYPELAHTIGIYTSMVSDKEKEEALTKSYILSTTKSTGAAMDIKGLKFVVVLAEPFKSEVLARQTIGRARDNNTTYIELVDTGFYYCNKYFLYKKPTFKKYAKDCQEVSVTNNEMDAKSERIICEREKCNRPIEYNNDIVITRPFIYF